MGGLDCRLRTQEWSRFLGSRLIVNVDFSSLINLTFRDELHLIYRRHSVTWTINVRLGFCLAKLVIFGDKFV